MSIPANQARAIFLEAVEQPDAGERAKYIATACGGDAELQARVERLMRSHEQLGSFHEDSPPTDATIGQPTIECPGAPIGPYKLLQQIGEGGMGVVYMADQEQPVRRRVALKIIKPGMDSRQVIARFEAERQALSLMDHPNIAKVLDAGTTDSGRPYFVMELVKGQPITQYCDEHRLTPRQRLELLLPVCQAIQHAHQKGIIHRDIKPTNILVAEYDQQPVPKVIDFGVAKATSQALTERTMFTGFGQIIGTLEYMSPEQAKVNQIDIDTRSDIYSLGVLLYELLTGTTPLEKHRLRSAGWDEMLRIIREEEPEKPSTRLSESRSRGLRATGGAMAAGGSRDAVPSGSTLASIAAVRGTEPARLSKLVCGELDWIVMKALERDRSRRYETAAGFAADLQRYLNDDPVQAGPPSAWYRMRKFARRNKGVLAAAAVLGLALLVVVSAIGWTVRDRIARRVEAQRDQAARQVKLTGQLQLILDQVARLEGQQKWPEALEAAMRASDLAGGGEADAVAIRRVQDAIDNLKLVQLLDDIRASRSESSDEMRFDFRGTAERYIAAFQDAGMDLPRLTFEEAAKRILSRSAVTGGIVSALDDWAVCHQAAGDKHEAERVWEVAGLADPDAWRQQVRAALRTRDDSALQTLAESPDIVRQPAATITCLEVALRERDRVDAAHRVLTLAQRQHPTDFWVHFGMAQVMDKQNPPSLEQAAGCYRAALAVRPRSAAAWNNLGNAQKKLNKLDDAVACYQRAIELDPKYFMAYANLGLARYKQEKRDDAIAAWKRAIELNPKGPMVLNNLGSALQDQGKIDDAIDCYNKAIALAPKFSVAHFNLGAALAKQQKLDEAIASYRTAIEIDPKFVLAHQRLAAILFGQKRDYEGAIEVIQKVITLRPDLYAPHFNLGMALKYLGKEREAITSHRKALQLQPNYVEACTSLARLLTTCADLQLRDPEDALQLAQKAIELAPQSAEAWAALGWAQYRSGDWKASIEALEKSIALEASPNGGNSAHWLFLAMAHWQLGNQDAARKWYGQAVEWTDKNQPQNQELRRLQVEAEELMKQK